ncbi:MAG TPA: hypothetical protein VJA25_15260 [Dehalococcoidia bacterium]|nr:hypothetical protein [Dehalococcoidia bacterium]
MITLTRKEIDDHLLKHTAGHCGENPCITVRALEEVLWARKLLEETLSWPSPMGFPARKIHAYLQAVGEI